MSKLLICSISVCTEKQHYLVASYGYNFYIYIFIFTALSVVHTRAKYLNVQVNTVCQWALFLAQTVLPLILTLGSNEPALSLKAIIAR